MTSFLLELVVDMGTSVTWLYLCNSRTFRMARRLTTGDSDSASWKTIVLMCYER